MLESILLATVLSTVLTIDPPANPPANPPAGGGDILRGPDVPADALKSEKERKKADQPAAEKLPRPMLEQRVLFAALDGLKLDNAKRTQVNQIKSDFDAAVAEWMRTSEAKRKELFDKRKKTPTGEPVSEEFKKGMEEIEAKRPKLASVKEQLSKVLSREELEQLRVAYGEGLKRAQAELTKRTEAERAKADEERKKKAEQIKKDAEKKQSEQQSGEKDGEMKPGSSA
ncbi:MAG: hypothetical protein RLZZ116_2278 [Planctomycetota bacterium]|jgi:hypothetical protein